MTDSGFGVDSRPAAPRPPVYNVEEERVAVLAALRERGHPLDRAKALACEAVSHLTADQRNGDPVWTTRFGEIRGGSGRQAVVDQLHEREHLASFGPDPLERACQELAELGVTREEALAHLQHKLRRGQDGGIEFATGGGVRTGGAELVDEAVRRAYEAVQKDRQGRGSAEAEADIRTRLPRI